MLIGLLVSDSWGFVDVVVCSGCCENVPTGRFLVVDDFSEPSTPSIISRITVCCNAWSTGPSYLAVAVTTVICV
jgi:hypothetical protein